MTMNEKSITRGLKYFKGTWSFRFCSTHYRLLFALFCDDHAYQLRLNEERNEFFLAILVERRFYHLQQQNKRVLNSSVNFTGAIVNT